MAIVYTVNGVSISENGTEEWTVNGVAVAETTAAAPAGAIMNQIQKANLGADLYNGALSV